MSKWEWNHVQNISGGKSGITRIEFNSDGFKQILMSSEVQSMVYDASQRIASDASSKVIGDSDGFIPEVKKGGFGGGRWIAYVTAADDAAAEAESESKVLTGAVHP